jgi:hypothetical protein
VFTARYALSPYIKQIRFIFKGLITTIDGEQSVSFKSSSIYHNKNSPWDALNKTLCQLQNQSVNTRLLRCAIIILSYPGSSNVIGIFSASVSSTGHVLCHVLRHTVGAHLRPVPVHATTSVARGGARRSRVS